MASPNPVTAEENSSPTEEATARRCSKHLRKPYPAIHGSKKRRNLAGHT